MSTTTPPPPADSSTSSRPPPSALLARAAAGDAEAFARLVEPLTVRLLVLVRRLGGGRLGADCAAEDVLQVALARAWQQLPRFEERGPHAFARWLAALARGAVADRGRYVAAKGRKSVHHFGDLPPEIADSATSIAHAVGRREQCARLEAALAALPVTQREVVAAHVLEARSLAEIAAGLGISKNAVWERLRRGLVALRDGLAEDPPRPPAPRQGLA